MKYTYDKVSLKEWLDDNIDTLLEDPKFQALIVEVKVAADAGNIFVNRTGHDEVTKDNTRIETKFTNYLMSGHTLRINSAGENKKDGFDYMRIIDGINERIFMIPHDCYFVSGSRYGSEFRWSGTYNEEDKIQRNNTELLIRYEITCKE